MIFCNEMYVECVQQMGSDQMIANAARVKSDGGLELLGYLMKHRHGSPFEHGCITFNIHAPIFVWREFHRHRIGFSYNEESARYTTLEPVFYIPPRDRPMMKVDNWKAGRPKFLPCDNQVYLNLVENLKYSYKIAYAGYVSNLSLGIDPGLARDCLPVGIYSTCWVTCNPRSIMAFLSLRTSDTGKSYPLYEIEVVAKKIEALFERYWPVTHAEFVKNGRIAP